MSYFICILFSHNTNVFLNFLKHASVLHINAHLFRVILLLPNIILKKSLYFQLQNANVLLNFSLGQLTQGASSLPLVCTTVSNLTNEGNPRQY